MKFLPSVVSIIACLVLFNQLASAFPTDVEKSDATWEEFKTTHKKSYATQEEEEKRREIFFANVQIIETHNADKTQTFEMGVNEFSDMTSEEFTAKMAGFRAPPQDANNGAPMFDASVYENVEQPASVDWRTKNVLTSVKQQGTCGSCWSFSATGALEAQTAIKKGRLPDLSEQNLIDCSAKYGTAGCNGGWPNYAFSYVRDNGGINTEARYPYEGRVGSCRFNKADIGATDTGFVNIAAGNETAMQIAVANIGPLSIAIGSSGYSAFQNYKSGVYNYPGCAQNTDHAILLVGYGTLNGTPYWIIKNSWGSSWGMGGYAYMSRNKGNQCAIASHASYPTV